MRHFKTKREAVKFRNEEKAKGKQVRVFRKIKGHRNRKQKPFVVGTEFEFLNLY